MTAGVRCRAHSSRTGERCKAWAIRGGVVCAKHGGGAPAVRAAARRRLEAQAAEADAAATLAWEGVAPVADPLDVLARLAGEADAMRGALQERVNALGGQIRYTAEGAGTEQLRAEVVLLERAMDRTARLVETMVRLDVEGRRVRLAEQQGALVAQVIRRVLNSLDLTPAQEALVGTVVPRELRALTAGGGGR